MEKENLIDILKFDEKTSLADLVLKNLYNKNLCKLTLKGTDKTIILYDTNRVTDEIEVRKLTGGEPNINNFIEDIRNQLEKYPNLKFNDYEVTILKCIRNKETRWIEFTRNKDNVI